MFNNNKHRAEDFLMGAVFGASVAAVAALLFAPQSGKKTREDISRRTQETKEQAGEYFEIAKDKGSEIYQTARDTGEKYWDDVTHQAESTLDKVTSKIKSDSSDSEDVKISENQSVDDVIEEAEEELKASPEVNEGADEKDLKQKEAADKETDKEEDGYI